MKTEIEIKERIEQLEIKAKESLELIPKNEKDNKINIERATRYKLQIYQLEWVLN